MNSPADLAKIRHELRTPINHILGYCEILLDEEDMPERMLEDLQKIHRGGKELLRLIGTYLDDAVFGQTRNWQQVQHELRTPVNHIIGYSELLIELAAEEGQRTLAADLARIRTAARQWLTLMETHLLRAEPAPGSEPECSSGSAAAPPSRSRVESPTPVCDPALLPASLLVVDDDSPSRELLARRLNRAGFQVATAADGGEALELISSRSFDLLLVDFIMPDMDGLQLLRHIREHKSATDLPVIMVTGRDSSGDIVEALHLGANDYLTKPIDFHVALARLATHLRWRGAQAELNKKMGEIRQLAEELQVRNDFIKRVFGRYVTDAVVQNVLENPKGLELGGQRRSVTVLMCDLRGFTGLAEQLPPEKVVELLNTYLGAMADVIGQYQGVVDEFIGDAVLALFGAPIARPDHAEAAVACALAMQMAMERVNRRLSRLEISPVEMGIGVNTGEVVVGNIGSDKRAKYGAVGAQVNLAARIQAVTVGGEVLVSDGTAAALGRRLKTDRTLNLSFKGIGSPVRIHSAVGLRGQDHLDLPADDFAFTAPSRTVTVNVLRLSESKMQSSSSSQAQLSIRSNRSGYLLTTEPLYARCDLKLALASASGSDLYCKVMEDAPGELGWLVRFTSPLPPW